MKSVTISVNNFHNKSFEVIGENKEYKKINPTIPIFIVATSLISSPVTQPVSVKPYVLLIQKNIKLIHFPLKMIQLIYRWTITLRR